MTAQVEQVPQEVLRIWECEADRLLKTIERDLTLLSAMKKRLAAVYLLQYRAKTGKTISDMSVPDVVLFALSQFDTPPTLHRLREYIALAGFPMERFGRNCAHFYVVIRRLVRQGKIHKDCDEVSLI